MYRLIEKEKEAQELLEKVVIRAHFRVKPEAMLLTLGFPIPTLTINKSHVVYVFVEEGTSNVFALFDTYLTYDPTKKKYRNARVPFVIGALPGCNCTQFASWLTSELSLTPEFTAFNHATILRSEK